MSESSESVAAEIQYLKPDPIYDDERPYAIASEPPQGLKRTNIVQQGVRTVIYNARGGQENFSLYSNGFEWVNHGLEYPVSPDENIDRYMQEMGELVRMHLKASKVVVYDYVVRYLQQSLPHPVHRLPWLMPFFALQIRQQRDKYEPRAPGVPRIVKKQILGAHLGECGYRVLRIGL